MDMEKLEQPASPEREEELRAFREEIKVIKEAELAKKQEWEARGRTGRAYNLHFDAIEPQHLGDAERVAYEVTKHFQLTSDEFKRLRGDAMRRFGDDKTSPEYKTVYNFWAYLANELNVKEGWRLLRKEKSE